MNAIKPDYMDDSEVCYIVRSLHGNAEQPRDSFLTIGRTWTRGGSWNPSRQHADTFPHESIAFYRHADNAEAARCNAPDYPNDGRMAPAVAWYPCYGADHIHVDA